MDSSTPIDPASNQYYEVPYLWFFLLTLVAIGIFLAIDQTSNLSSIKDDWAEYRCQPHIMPFAGLFGHDINENFQFCIQQIIQEKTTGVAAPFAQGMSGFTGILGNLMKSANSFRVMLATLVGGVIKIISEFKSRMDALMGRVKLTASRMKAMMYRIYGTMFAVMYMGMSAITGIANVGDSFIFGFIDTFCFAAETEVILENSSVTRIKDLTLGTRLRDGQLVEAVLEVPGSLQLYMLHGVQVSGEHLVLYKKSFVPVKEHPDAIKTGGLPSLWTLITSNRRIPVRGLLKSDLTFSDWEEMPSTLEAAAEWDSIVRGIINNGESASETKISSYAPCFDSTIKVIKYQSGLVPLSRIVIGDWIMGKNTWTKVIGTCSRHVGGGLYSHGNRMTDGVWILSENSNSWTHPEGVCDRRPWRGVNLITDSGAFRIHLASFHTFIVRDFTEVGWKHLKETYEKERKWSSE